MRPQPITIVEPQIHALAAGRLTRLYRLAGPLLEQARPGDLLWVREPFWLPSCYDHISPSQAAERGAVPNFIADFSAEQLAGIPRKRRYAREFLRIWHRQHLRVTAVERGRLMAVVGDEQIEEQGYNSWTDFIRSWDSNQSFGCAGDRWANNPDILVLDFERIAAPLPTLVAE